MVATVLVADNEVGVRALLAELVARTGARVLQAADGQQAVDALASEPVDVLICDLDMPRVAGAEVVAAAAALPKPPAVLVVSGFLDAATTARLQAQPCVRQLLRKPFDILAFLELVRTLVAEANARAAVAAPAVVLSACATEAVAAAVPEVSVGDTGPHGLDVAAPPPDASAPSEVIPRVDPLVAASLEPSPATASPSAPSEPVVLEHTATERLPADSLSEEMPPAESPPLRSPAPWRPTRPQLPPRIVRSEPPAAAEGM